MESMSVSYPIIVSHRFRDAVHVDARNLQYTLGLKRIRVEFGDCCIGPWKQKVKNLIESAMLLVVIFGKEEYDGANKWLRLEIRWAWKAGIPILLLVERGAKLGRGRITREQKIDFESGKFPLPEVSERIIGCFPDLVFRAEFPHPELPRKISELILEARNHMSSERFPHALKVAREARTGCRQAWRAWNIEGTANLKMGKTKRAKQIFQYVAENFPSFPEAVATALHNTAWSIETEWRSDPFNPLALQPQRDCYERALAIYGLNDTRASLFLCVVMQGDEAEMRKFFSEFKEIAGFRDTLREEIDKRGHLGRQVLTKMPGDLSFEI
jgi:hypothetical protein